MPNMFENAKILLSLIKVNPFSKLTKNDLSREKTQPFSVFRGTNAEYAFPATTFVAAERVKENVKLFIGNYITVFVVIFLISMYKQPIPFLTLLLSFPLKDYINKLLIAKGIDVKYPFVPRLLYIISKIGLVALLARLEVILAFFSSLLATYFAMLLHGGLRKLRDRENWNLMQKHFRSRNF